MVILGQLASAGADHRVNGALRRIICPYNYVCWKFHEPVMRVLCTLLDLCFGVSWLGGPDRKPRIHSHMKEDQRLRGVCNFAESQDTDIYNGFVKYVTRCQAV